MDRYWQITREAPNPAGQAALVAYLNRVLPPIWAADYQAMTTGPSAVVTMTFSDAQHPGAEINTMFDHASSAGGTAEDRVVVVWGLSRAEPADTRDSGRMAGFLRGVWSATHPGYDRGHFFAHTMGGGTDINLFPQLASVNRGGLWRDMERYAVDHPGTFCFIRPIYTDTSWKPTQLEYGIYKMPPEPVTFWGATFPN